MESKLTLVPSNKYKLLLICQEPSTKPDGTPRTWVLETTAARQMFALSDASQANAWTDRPEVQMRGCSQQMHPYNFLHETVNVRWLRFCADFQLPPDSAPPSFLCTDTSQSINRQPKSGRVTMLTSSKIYWHQRDRSICAREHFLQNGWERDIDLTDVNEAVEGWPASATQTSQSPRAPATKHAAAPPENPRAKRRRVSHAPQQPRLGLERTVVDLAANGMALPDCALIMYTSLLSTRDGVFEHQPDLGFTFRRSTSGSATGWHFRAGTCWQETMQEILQSLAADPEENSFTGDAVDGGDGDALAHPADSE